jgi:hypothetical protein
MIVDILTASQSIADGVPQTTWAYKETSVVNWSPIGFTQRVEYETRLGGQTYPADSRAFLEWNADVIPGNRLSYQSGTTYYDVLSVYNYEDHIELELKKVVQ